MMDMFERGISTEDLASAVEDMALTVAFADRAAELARMAAEALERGQPKRAMRLVQRIRYACQMRADILLMVLDDLHFLATGSEDFDHELWMKATKERDYDALSFAMNMLECARYSAGADIAGDCDE